jgi:ubiquinone/menaquinone biosynthesis C-methylase UbiE
MNSAFDSVAEEYDATFTQTKIGRAQREIVWSYLDKILSGKERLKILELNCGTGEDALWFAKKGYSVLATDVSEKMLEVTMKKTKEKQLSDKIKTLKADLSNIKEFISNENFDLIFSNFGGINCIAFRDLYNLPDALSKLLKPSGRLIMIIMPEFCLWEMIYYSLKLKLIKAFRRSSTMGAKVKLNSEEIVTYYYSPIMINKIFRKDFEQAALKPVGFFIPPSYLERFFATKNKTFNLIKKLESLVTKWSMLSNYSDHFLIDLLKK